MTSVFANEPSNFLQSAKLLQSAKRILEGADQSLLLLGHFMGHIDTLVEGVGNDTRRIKSDAQDLAQAFTDRFTLAKRGVQASPKALQVAKVLLSIALKYRIEGGRLASGGASEQSDKRLTALHESSANTLRELCVEARGTFLKLGQFLSMRPDLLPAPYIRQLATLRNQVPALPFSLILEVVEAELGAPLDSLFAHIDEEPVAAASLAQVHRAWGLDGEAYALKVQVPGAAEQVGADIAILRAVAYALSESSLPFDTGVLLNQLADSIREELDYVTEASHCEALGSLLATQPGIISPKVVRRYSSKRVLTMTWMEGQCMDLALKTSSKSERKQILSTLVGSYCSQIFKHGYFQADPHSGNLLVQQDQTVVLLDFGCAQILSEETRAAYVELMKAVFIGNQEALRKNLELLGFHSDDENPAALESLVVTMLDMLKREDAMNTWAREPQAAAAALLEATRAVPGLVTPRHFVLLGRVLATLGGLLIENADAEVSLPTLLANSLMDSQ